MSRIRKLVPPIAITAAVIAVWYTYKVWIVHSIDSPELRAQHGDMFGGVSALFSGLAFAGLIYAILLQREELSLQRRELQMTREELHRTAKANEEAAKALERQTQNQLLAARISGLGSLLASTVERLADISRENEGFRARGQMVSVSNPDLVRCRDELQGDLENLLKGISEGRTADARPNAVSRTPTPEEPPPA